MALTVGTRLGAYEITGPIGAGGMGEVYRARDTRLKREVALKILPESFATDRDRLARFEREAEVLASLNHPNIAAIYGFEEGPAEAGHHVHALVLELVEGPTLADRIAQGAIPLVEALPIARQIAEALDAAHEQGIVHRDLKPANVKVRPDGTVKVLDFGLAKAFEAESAPVGMSVAPTITSPAATRIGTILGTAAYMSPEQARGKAVDKRTDIWAFGCVLYEMLTGRRAFEGEEIPDVLARILEREPDLNALPPATPPAVMRLLRRCLQKDRRQRLPDIGVARLEIDDALTSPQRAGRGSASAPAIATRERIGWAAAAIATAVLAWFASSYTRPAPVPLPEMRLQIETPGAPQLGQFTEFALSPDGRAVVFLGPAPGARSQLWARELSSETATPLAGTENGFRPFWSPDGRALAFVADGQLKRLDIADRRIQTLASPAAGGTWNTEGTILFPRTFTGPLFRVAATGGEATQVTRVDPPRHSGHVYPYFLPDGRHFLFFAFGSPEGKGAYLGSLESTDVHRLVQTDAAAVFAPPDLVLYAQQEALVARRLDLAAQELTGEPMTVAPQVAVDVLNGKAAIAASPAGVIAYRARPAERQLTWYDRSGQRMATVGAPDAGLGGTGRVSPDGRTSVVSRTLDGNTDIWLMDMSRATLRRFTVDRAADTAAVWSPDGTRIVFSSDRRAGVLELYEKRADGSDAETLLLESSQDTFANDWSPDGRYLLYRSTDAQTRADVWALPLSGERRPFPIARTAAYEDFARVSPDGRWVAYGSNESGRTETYVQPFPGPGPKVQISTDGGQMPQWRGDGREIFYNDNERDQLMAVPVAFPASGIDAGTPVVLFSKPEGAFAATPDGRRFLFAAPSDQANPITILLNWAGVGR